MEQAPFGIEVVTMQPGAVTSNIGETGNNNVALPADSIRTSLAKIIHGRAVTCLMGAMATRDFARQVAMAVLCFIRGSARRRLSISRPGNAFRCF
jgi:NAD(P)-dependent dehydrogenase (short-subunit alcohol dehydrogenase family)